MNLKLAFRLYINIRVKKFDKKKYDELILLYIAFAEAIQLENYNLSKLKDKKKWPTLRKAGLCKKLFEEARKKLYTEYARYFIKHDMIKVGGYIFVYGRKLPILKIENDKVLVEDTNMSRKNSYDIISVFRDYADRLSGDDNTDESKDFWNDFPYNIAMMYI